MGITRVFDVIGVGCPKLGAVERVVFPFNIAWLGEDPREADICIGRTVNDQYLHFATGLFQIDRLSASNVQAIREAMIRVASELPGTEVGFTITARSSNAFETRPVRISMNWRVIGQVPSVTREAPDPFGWATDPAWAFTEPAWVIDGLQVEGDRLVGTSRLWFGVKSRVILKSVDRSVVTGRSTLFEAKGIRFSTLDTRGAQELIRERNAMGRFYPRIEE